MRPELLGGDAELRDPELLSEETSAVHRIGMPDELSDLLQEVEALEVAPCELPRRCLPPGRDLRSGHEVRVPDVVIRPVIRVDTDAVDVRKRLRVRPVHPDQIIDVVVGHGGRDDRHRYA